MEYCCCLSNIIIQTEIIRMIIFKVKWFLPSLQDTVKHKEVSNKVIQLELIFVLLVADFVHFVCTELLPAPFSFVAAW